jgi:hypothetical protein
MELVMALASGVLVPGPPRLMLATSMVLARAVT